MRIDLTMIENENQLHELMANCFGFPDYYGKNWDAFWDCLCDSDLPKVKVASLKIAFGRRKFLGCKVWKGQVYEKPVLAEVLAR
ncbi:barstar family protein [Vibrio natriegens]|uniref:barstar family protein n=1 Tax=Vibrio natriegens TaxID=691 RepID=UPI000357ADFA|nr:barstar family protein [Vibrio natriegens]EPM40479.1 hypothetical protein M272_12635 [Vibrio natriegens NBRC 15636 = ATCC 14048 = DSM 759]MDX6027264.1 barstar family protein [Vibrio natriegens NBRC 15636 = ATCC 14048 = DSM 759]UUI10588.1 barstar family protein [Vibrio natriegens]WRS47473.1 barstar family protein [Vibrio natriegens NBRC 15636 = ATCC 14048 = DSM 759]